MRIDIFHDTACPWCRIGKHHLATALEMWEGEVELHYHTFFLNAGIPPEGYPFQEYMRAKFATDDLSRFFDAPNNAGAAVGITFNFDAIHYAPNTILSHRLIHMVPDQHKPALIDAIYSAYFEHGQDIGSLEVLLSLAQRLGLDAAELRPRLESDEGHQFVLSEAAQAQQMGVTGVPMFVFNNMLAVSGAQSPEMLLRVMHQAADLNG